MISNAEILAALPAMWRYAQSFGPASHEPQDLVQATCERAIRSRDSFVSGHAESWLITIMRNLHGDMVRERSRQVGREISATAHQLAIAGKSTPSHEAAIAAIETMNLMYRTNPLDANVLVQQAAGYSDEERAALDNIPLGTAKTRLLRARRRLLGAPR